MSPHYKIHGRQTSTGILRRYVGEDEYKTLWDAKEELQRILSTGAVAISAGANYGQMLLDPNPHRVAGFCFADVFDAQFGSGGSLNVAQKKLSANITGSTSIRLNFCLRAIRTSIVRRQARNCAAPTNVTITPCCAEKKCPPSCLHCWIFSTTCLSKICCASRLKPCDMPTSYSAQKIRSFG